MAKTPLKVVPQTPSNLTSPPANLSEPGASLWRSVIAEYDIADSGGREMLRAIQPAFPRCARWRVKCEADFGILYKEVVGSSRSGHGWSGG
jgi:hypothetical protein